MRCVRSIDKRADEEYSKKKWRGVVGGLKERRKSRCRLIIPLGGNKSASSSGSGSGSGSSSGSGVGVFGGGVGSFLPPFFPFPDDLPDLRLLTRPASPPSSFSPSSPPSSAACSSVVSGWGGSSFFSSAGLADSSSSSSSSSSSPDLSGYFKIDTLSFLI